jgi:hypothetical protein
MASFAQKHYGRLIFLLWVVASALLVFIGREAIVNWRFGDPDDQLRIVQVRDWLDGQSWWDITQYRMNLPDGGPMHWSRLIDIPIAAMILFFGLFLSPATAEQAACATVPLLTLGIALWLYAGLGRRLFGAVSGLIASVMLITLLPVMTQLVPMRIDHHGWQFILFMGATAALFSRQMRLTAAVAIGLCMALWLEISIEGLPFAVLFIGLLAIRWFFPTLGEEQRSGHAFVAALVALTGGTLLLFSVTERWLIHGNHCDSLSPVHIAALAMVSTVILLGYAATHRKTTAPSLWVKLAVCAAGGIAGLAIVLGIAPQCSGDAFASLDPLVRSYWYDRVPEGLPVWALPSQFAAQYWGGFTAVAIGIVFIIRSRQPDALSHRISLLLLVFCSTIIGLFVSRTALYAIALGNLILAPLIVMLMQRAEQLKGLASRMGFRIVAIALMVPATISQNIEIALAEQKLASDPGQKAYNAHFEKLTRACQKSTAAKALNALPKGSRLMVGLDTAPAVLVFTDHKVVATGHHRNQHAMRDVIQSFIGTEADARRIYKARGIDYLVTCEGSYELHEYHQRARHGFGAQVKSGNLPAWLKRHPSIGPFSIYRVTWEAGV